MATDFDAKTPDPKFATVAHQANTWVDVAGSGILIGVVKNEDTIAVQIDGGSIYNLDHAGTRAMNLVLIWPFASALKITSVGTTDAAQHAFYLLD